MRYFFHWYLKVLVPHNFLNQVSKGDDLVYSSVPQILTLVSFKSLIINYLHVDTVTVLSAYDRSIQGPIKNSSCLKFWSHYFNSVVEILNIHLPPLMIWTSISYVFSTCGSHHTHNPIIVWGFISTKNPHTLVEYIRIPSYPLLNNLG